MNFLPPPLYFGTKPSSKLMMERDNESDIKMTWPRLRFSWSVFLIIIRFSSAKARLFNNIKVLKKLLYPSFTLKRRIIQRYTLRFLRYCKSRFAYGNNFKDIEELVRGDLKTSGSLNLIKILGLKGAGRYEKARINWKRLFLLLAKLDIPTIFTSSTITLVISPVLSNHYQLFFFLFVQVDCLYFLEPQSLHLCTQL